MRENVGSSEQVKWRQASNPRTEVTDAEDGSSKPVYVAQTSILKKQPQNKNLRTQKTPLLKLTLEIKTATMYTTMSSLLHMLKA